MNLFLQSNVNDENNSKIESIDLSSSKMQILYHCYNVHAKDLTDDNQVGYAFDPIYNLAKKKSILFQIRLLEICCLAY